MASGRKLSYQQPLLISGWERFPGWAGEPVKCDGKGCRKQTADGFYHQQTNRFYCNFCCEIEETEVFDQFTVSKERWDGRGT